MSAIRALLTAFAFASVVRAHFNLDYPYTRGFDDDLEGNTICGGFNTPNATRTPFPLDGGFISIESHHPSANAVAVISFDNNPTGFNNFNQTSSGSTYGQLKPFWQMSAEGAFCLPVDVGRLAVPGVQNGTNATILVQFNGGDGTLFQCSDVVLLSDYTVPSSISCKNVSTITGGTATGYPSTVSITAPPSSASQSSSSAAPSSSSTTKNGAIALSPMLGGAGAGMALVAVGMSLLL